MDFYVGLHQPSDAKHFVRSCISINRLRRRRKHIVVGDVILDSGAFSELHLYGRYRHDVEAYAREIVALVRVMPITIAVSQDYMCEPSMLKKTGLTVTDHQQLTIKRYDALMMCSVGVPIMPVIQGFAPEDYARHIQAYGDRLEDGQWVGVGSVCKRNASVIDIVNVLGAIRESRPDLRLHGFGLKLTALADPGVRSMLYSADSMAWSYSARKQGRDGNSWIEADNFRRKVDGFTGRSDGHWQPSLAFY